MQQDLLCDFFYPVVAAFFALVLLLLSMAPTLRRELALLRSPPVVRLPPRTRTVIPAKAGIHAELSKLIHKNVAKETGSLSQPQYGFPPAREVISGNAGNDGLTCRASVCN